MAYRKAAVVVAGGTGTRLGAGMPKQMISLAGRPILAHTLDRFLAHDPDLVIVTVLHGTLVGGWDAFVQDNFPPSYHPRLLACPGGTERTESVHAGLQYLALSFGANPVLVAIHDAVRPFVDERMLNEGFALAAEKGNAVAGVPVKSSLRMRTPEGSQAVDRSLYYHVQTPQIFWLKEILSCYDQRPEGVFTDDASLAEALGMKIQLFEGSYDNVKITTLEDLVIAERLMGGLAK